MAIVPEKPSFEDTRIIWATDSYAGHSHKFEDFIPEGDKGVDLIVPRVEKNKSEQKKRTKDKAEVFTPIWVTILQNNLVDDHVLGRAAFGKFDKDDRKLWIPSKEPIFTEEQLEEAVAYICSPRLEITCGEAPYLIHRYDTTTGEHIPVRDEHNRFARSGLLDRKLRVVSEIVSAETWVELAREACNSIYGYEWQGDNLYIARKNFVLSFIEYYEDFFKTEPTEELVKEFAEIASWQLWQMDGLKMVIPGTCGEDCVPCAKKSRKNHAGIMPALRWGEEITTFDRFLPDDSKKK